MKELLKDINKDYFSLNFLCEYFYRFLSENSNKAVVVESKEGVSGVLAFRTPKNGEPGIFIMTEDDYMPMIYPMKETWKFVGVCGVKDNDKKSDTKLKDIKEKLCEKDTSK